MQLNYGAQSLDMSHSSCNLLRNKTAQCCILMACSGGKMVTDSLEAVRSILHGE